MAETHYAWSNFPVDTNEWGRTTKTVKAGHKVTQQELKVDDATWDEWLDLGVIRTQPYPDVGTQMSPTEHYDRLDAAVAGGTATEEQRKEHAELRPAFVDTEEEEATAKATTTQTEGKTTPSK